MAASRELVSLSTRGAVWRYCKCQQCTKKLPTKCCLAGSQTWRRWQTGAQRTRPRPPESADRKLCFQPRCAVVRHFGRMHVQKMCKTFAFLQAPAVPAAHATTRLQPAAFGCEVGGLLEVAVVLQSRSRAHVFAWANLGPGAPSGHGHVTVHQAQAIAINQNEQCDTKPNAACYTHLRKRGVGDGMNKSRQIAACNEATLQR